MAHKIDQRTDRYYRYAAAPGKKYDLIFRYRNFRNTVLLIEAELYSAEDGHFLGTWASFNMPTRKKLEFEKWIQKHFARSFERR